MSNYFAKSFDKFKQDALSKFFYDILKWLVPATVVFAFSKLLPSNTTLGQLLSREVSFSLYEILLFLFVLVALTVFIVALIFNKIYKKLKNDSAIDELTGLKNHKAFRSYLMQMIEGSDKSGRTFSTIMLDVDDFKRFNTEYSPNIADKILSKVGELLRNDKRITDEVFRQFLRGDEFIVVANETSLNDAERAAERKRVLINKTGFIVDADSYSLSVSCGVTEYKRGVDNFESITDRVNRALVEAKMQTGKNNTKISI